MDEAVRIFFNARAGNWMEHCWKEFFAGNEASIKSCLDALFEATALTHGSRVLDVGCGDGFLVPFILQRIGPEGRLTELDIAENMIEQNRRRHPDPRITFRVADVSDLAPTHAYDTVIAFSCFPHFHNQCGVLEAFRGQLRHGGRMAVCHAKSSAEMNAFHRNADPAVSKHRLPEGDAMRDLILEAGLQPIRIIDGPGLYLATATTVEIRSEKPGAGNHTGPSPG